MQGGTITISNLGPFGISRFTAIINPPESCILAVGSAFNRPYLDGSTLKERPTITITASFDHRVIDGAYGATFLVHLRDLLENPVLMLLIEA
jgi:pyruvate dehydrogenase E2 component (dihydrolipoamide acetyltransferase)